jgi:hypothetical protein
MMDTHNTFFFPGKKIVEYAVESNVLCFIRKKHGWFCESGGAWPSW